MNKSSTFTALRIITTLFTLFFHYQSAAQFSDEADAYTDRVKVISVGALLGSNFCQVDGDNYSGYHKMGLNVGGIGYVRINKNVAFSFELLYSQRGAKDNGVRYSALDSATLITKYRINTPYAEIPLMINYFDKHKSHFGTGISYSRLLNVKEEMESNSGYMVDFTKYPFRNSTLDYVISAQMHVWKGLFFNVRFQYGITPMRSESPEGMARAQKQYNNLWSVRLLYMVK
jgi:hypothetical protein